jgi:Uma2 family endonuclease
MKSINHTTIRKGRVTMPLPKEQTYTIDDIYALPEGTRAELIDGQIYYMAPPSRRHQEILGELYTAINNYIKSKDGPCKVYPTPFAVKLNEDDKTIVEPDISVICDPNKLTDKGCTGSPDWIIEITSPSNSSHDYVLKLNKYMNAGVREYWIVNPMNKTVYVYCFEERQFNTVPYIFHDKIKVGIYDDLYIDFSQLNI